ncbi:MAG TPA: methyltransferase domain-containing protein [Solirubrobacteraceae bacterium]|nr:methyltransferase domain-containing protein [Solirubrobacteraceae bacterium]
MAQDDPAAFFERMYVDAAESGGTVPWDRGGPHPLLEPWARDLDGAGRRALVVGSGPGSDAELLAARGFDVLAFDFAPSAVALARERFPDSAVEYLVADLLDPPQEWTGAFHFVLEILTVQSLPPAFHAPATANIARMVARGGTLLVIATANHDAAGPGDGPPWPLTRAEVEAFAAGDIELVGVEDVREPGVPARWRAEFRRPSRSDQG